MKEVPPLAAIMVVEEDEGSGASSLANVNNSNEAWTCSCNMQWPSTQKRCGNTKCNKVSEHCCDDDIFYSFCAQFIHCHSFLSSLIFILSSLIIIILLLCTVEGWQARWLHCPPFQRAILLQKHCQCTHHHHHEATATRSIHSSSISSTTTTSKHHRLLDMRQLSKHCQSQQSAMWTMPSLEGWEAYYCEEDDCQE